mmetsp:Transcript_8677/g.19629  ORF Transcript_8677/g.19629 Transcript_8677/m.19629 type:complete len:127 (+) Transcript_8677:3523-3903(+)
MATLAPHVIAATILLNSHMTLRTVLDRIAGSGMTTTKQRIVKGVGIGTGLASFVRFLAATETKGGGTGTANAGGVILGDAIEQISTAADGDHIAVGSGTPADRFHATTTDEGMELQALEGWKEIGT